MSTSANFFEKVYQVARQIPYGKVTTYGAIAKAIGAAKSARMVGYAMNGAGEREDVPAHRVVNRKGVLTGKHHFSGTNLMQQLLESEGVQVKDNQIQNFQEVLWEPEILSE
ncbi:MULTISPECIES: MGMT family protein [Mesonia]|uniref:DNA base-flipping protein n=1 Tax=Mesonia oceanica TaxID=2687242 RepID=A0AC61Y596_9FLAO|nr:MULTISPECIES: MGMT family protein [Mesonia]MAN29012.1 cysteine methyltransferase [Mesonia sp.]MAQ42792.1 cysteine methyltransferase [Mesonia sp.]MBJ99330.1 cysteine methyltransferase [Flavobacteriaceae bacterium]VVU99670.1 DNA base-flipping protein [Mesonia oceanica]|tara:strand:+ start:23580 stop:23912 length:333 start_codon:yes stop_codon:yes gene_type:complete